MSTTTRAERLSSYVHTKEGFMLANREVRTLPSAISLAATWIWVQALFVSTGMAHLNGYVGLFYFTFANALALVLFAPFLHRYVAKMPEGWTIPSYYRERFSPRVQGAVLFQYASHSTAGFAVNVLVGASLISLITGWSYLWVSVGLAVGAFAYTGWAGMKASIITDWIQYAVIVTCALIIVPVAVAWAVGNDWSSIAWSGVNDVSFTNAQGVTLLLTFGIPVSIGLLSGPLTEQMYWNRGLVVSKHGSPFRVAMYAAGFFAAVPLMLGFLGFAGASAGVKVEGPLEQAGFYTLQAMIDSSPAYAALLLPYALLAVAGILSTADSMLSSLGMLAGHDGARGKSDKVALLRARVVMVLMVAVVIAVANVPAMNLIVLWFFYYTLRVATMVPTMLALGRPEWMVTERGMFYGIVAGFVTGPPILVYGFLEQSQWFQSAGVVVGLVASGTVAAVVSRLTRDPLARTV